MEKKYNLPEENTENNEVSEPAIAYRRTLPKSESKACILPDLNAPCLFTDEEKIQQLEQGLEDIKNGRFISHEDVLQRIKRRL